MFGFEYSLYLVSKTSASSRPRLLVGKPSDFPDQPFCQLGIDTPMMHKHVSERVVADFSVWHKVSSLCFVGGYCAGGPVSPMLASLQRM